MGETVCLSSEQKRAALQAVTDSETFARSDQLRSFLSYIGDMAISGHGREITEYLIAINALGRSADFSPADDSSVRSRAYELRRKLQKYYELEEPNAPIRVVLPKGAYAPRFVAREEAGAVACPESHDSPGAETPAEAELPPEPRLFSSGVEPRGHHFSRREIILMAALVLAVPLCVTLGYVVSAGKAARHEPEPVITQALGALAKPEADVVLCVATTLHLDVRPYMTAVAEGLPIYPAPAELYPLFRQHRPLPAGIELNMHPVDNSIQMGHSAAVVAFSRILAERGVRHQILPERAARITSMRGRNVVLIGEPQNSEAVALYLEKTPLTLAFDPAAQEVVVLDRRKPGEPRRYVPERGQDRKYTEVYGVISVVPTPGATGAQQSVIVSGLTSVGAQGAAEFFSSVKPMTRLLERLHKDGYTGFPPAYQVVVRCKSRDTLLVSSEYVTHAVFRP